MTTISLINHSWLDGSESWFLRVNDNRINVEFTTEEAAKGAGKNMADTLNTAFGDGNAVFVDEIDYTSELFS